MNKTFTLMLIDDDEDDTLLFTESAMEADPDIRCITFPDGVTGLEYLKDELNPLPDYIFLDLRMPRMSGQKCIEELKKTERLSQIPVFIYTTSKDENDISVLKDKGAIMFISKPTNPD